MSESNEQPRQQSEEQAPPQTPQGELWVKDVNENGRWGTRSRKEVYCVIAAIILMIAATATGVLVAVENANKKNKINSTEPIGNTTIDPITGDVISAYVLPTKPAPTMISDQEELDIILTTLSSNTFLAGKVAVIPNTVDALAAAASDDADPFTKAAAWITGTDTFNAKEDVMNRFVLAALYHTTAGPFWKNTTNWMTSTYHCDWFGVECCEEKKGTVGFCKPDMFGQIIEIDLYKNNLAGPMPTSIILLDLLHVVHFGKNGLTGQIPGAELASMKNFAKLYAPYNYLSGTIPVDFANLKIFNTLYVHGNNITGIYPEELCTCQLCAEGIAFLGIDCEKIECNANCCDPVYQCFYLEKSALKD